MNVLYSLTDSNSCSIQLFFGLLSNLSCWFLSTAVDDFSNFFFPAGSATLCESLLTHQQVGLLARNRYVDG